MNASAYLKDLRDKAAGIEARYGDGAKANFWEGVAQAAIAVHETQDAEIAALKAQVERLKRLETWIVEEIHAAGQVPLGASEHGGPFDGVPTFDLRMHVVRTVMEVINPQ